MIGKNRFIKKLLSLFLSAAVIGGTAIALPAAVQEGTVTASAASAQVPEGYIGISTPEEFMSITDAPSKNYILLNDIDMSDTAPDGLLHGYIPHFWGVLNGNGHTVSNLHCERNSSLKSYFIGYNRGTVTDLVFKDLYVESSYESVFASFIYENKGTVSNIVVDNIIRYSEETCNYTHRSFVVYNSGTLRNIRISTSGITDNGILCYSNSNLIDGCSAFNTPLDSYSYEGSMVYRNNSKGTVTNSFCVIPNGYLVSEMSASYIKKTKSVIF